MLTLSDYDKQKVLAARDMAKKFHYRQMYGEHPYVYHLDQVAYNAQILYNRDCELSPVQFLQVSYLHDSIEDCKVLEPARTVFDIEFAFGKQVLKEVQILTHYPQVSYDDYIKEVMFSDDARTIKIADMIANLMESFSQKNYGLIRKYKKYLPNLLLQ